MNCLTKASSASRRLPCLFSLFLAASSLFLPTAISHAIPLDPITIYESFAPENSTIHYTVDNAAFSPFDLVSFIISTDPDAHGISFYMAQTINGWAGEAVTPTSWEDPMIDDNINATYGLSWADFYGTAWPFGAHETAVGFFLPYSDVGDGFFAFDNPSMSVAPGELLGGFYAVGVYIASDYAGTGADPEEPFTGGDFSGVSGASVPEPGGLPLMLVSAALGLASSFACRLWRAKRQAIAIRRRAV